MATDHAIANGMGKGEYQACFANFRAMTVVLAPLLYGRSYAYFAPRGQPGMPWFFGAAIVLMAEALHQSISEEECTLPAVEAKKAA
jgi:hypothetical protein